MSLTFIAIYSENPFLPLILFFIFIFSECVCVCVAFAGEAFLELVIIIDGSRRHNVSAEQKRYGEEKRREGKKRLKHKNVAQR